MIKRIAVRPRRRLCIFFFLMALAVSLGPTLLVSHAQQPSQASPVAADSSGGVSGIIAVRVPQQAVNTPSSAATSGNLIFLPDFEVFLQNIVTGELSQPVKTDLFGHFEFMTQKAGTYDLRWKQQGGWQEGLFGKEIVIANGTASYSGLVEIQPGDGGLLIGQVKRADGQSPWVHEVFFGVDFTAQVAALDAGGNKVGEPVRVNAAGEFAIAGLPNAPLRVRATSEAAVVVQAVSASALSFGGPVSPVTLTFNQPRPQILSIVPKVNQIAVRTVTPGATVTVTVDARGFGQSALKYDWRLQNGAGSILKPVGAVVDWTLPTAPGSYTAYVLVSDGLGGYVTGSVSVMVGLTQEGFAAQALSASGTSPGGTGPSLTALAALATPIPAHGQLLSKLDGNSSKTTAIAYYQAVDPQGLRTYVNADPAKGLKHLSDWWRVNGFDPTTGAAAGEVRTSYLNNNDLGSGRDMHFLRHPDGTVSAYVTNYLHKGQFDQNAMSADDALNQNPAARAATVCMEWSQIEGQSGAIVKFFVYGSGGFPDPSPDQDVIQEGIDLGVGTKFVPNLCLECHGDTQAKFREFDTATFKYPGGRSGPNATEQAAFKRQNLIVRGRDQDITLSTRAIKDLINGWYGIAEIKVGTSFLYIDPHPSFASEMNNWFPSSSSSSFGSSGSSGWSGQVDLYQKVVAKSCRTCHISFGDGLNWASYDLFHSNKPLILSDVEPDPTVVPPTARIMPHAPITYLNFWTDPDAAPTLLNFTNQP
jgi:hypothetical protein